MITLGNSFRPDGTEMRAVCGRVIKKEEKEDRLSLVIEGNAITGKEPIKKTVILNFESGLVSAAQKIQKNSVLCAVAKMSAPEEGTVLSFSFSGKYSFPIMLKDGKIGEENVFVGKVCNPMHTKNAFRCAVMEKRYNRKTGHYEPVYHNIFFTGAVRQAAEAILSMPAADGRKKEIAVSCGAPQVGRYKNSEAVTYFANSFDII